MSLVLVWNDDATPHADRDLLNVATFAATTLGPSEDAYTFQLCQADMVTAFRLLVSRNIIDHTQITLRVQQLVVTFDQDGDLVYPAGWPVPTYAQDLLCNLRMEVRWRKLAATSPQVVD
ncbi:hypothetical protein D3C81_1574670 [compost metagenome]